MSYVGWCKCNRYLLTLQQLRDKQPCDLCQKEEHAQSLEDRTEKLQKEEEE